MVIINKNNNKVWELARATPSILKIVVSLQSCIYN
jgi:hypothetical protein